MDTYEKLKKDWEDLEVTNEELKNLSECLKKEEFRKLLIEYAEEVNDPENKKIYEKEITELEKQRGVDVTFVNPEPGYVIKTSINGEKKCFINIGKSDIIARPTSQPSYEQGHRGLQWSIPYSLIPPREDVDKKSIRCVVFDVVFHPDTVYLASKNAQFREIVNNTAMDGVETNFKVKLDRKNIRFPKMTFKGTSQPTVIRKPSKEPMVNPSPPENIEPEIYQKLMSSYDEHCRRQEARFNKEETKPQRPSPPTTYYNKDKKSKSHGNDDTNSRETAYVTPKFIVKYQSDLEMEDFTNDRDGKIHAAIPKKLIIVIDLPLLKSANDASLDVQERSLSLTSEKPAKYKLELPLPYSVNADIGNAKFDSKYKKLTVTLPVIRRTVSTLSDPREDSGVESDHGSSPPPVMESQESIPMDNDCSEKEEKQCRDKTCKIVELDTDECTEDTALRTNNQTISLIPPFMNPDIKYTLPPFTFNVYDNQLITIVNVKNVDPNSIKHRILDENLGMHVLFSSVGAGFFPTYYSFCLKVDDNSIITESLKIEPWDNNVIFTIALKNPENLAHCKVGLDEQFMEMKDLPTAASFKEQLNNLRIEQNSQSNNNNNHDNKNVEVDVVDDGVVINISSNHLDSDDEEEEELQQKQHVARSGASQKQNRKHVLEKSRSVSESSGDELPNICDHSVRRSKGILKTRRVGDFSRSVSESSADENILPASSVEMNYDSIHDNNSESECSSLKKTVRFNDVVSRQLFRSNSSILGQRKKNQRKLRNKKRAHERRMSESENSENEERDKYRISNKNTSENESSDHIKPILSRDKSSEEQSKNINSSSIKIEKQQKRNDNDCRNINNNLNDNNNPMRENITQNQEELNYRGSGVDGSSLSVQATENKIQPEFKSDLIFDLDM